MPFQATCPECKTALRVADETRGKKVRCSKCQTVFFASGAVNGGPSSAVKPARPPAVKPQAAGASAISKSKAKAAPRPSADDDDAPAPVKKKKSVLPFVLAGCGALFLLCGGGISVAGYMIYKGVNSAAEAVQEKGQQFAEEFEKAAKEQQRLNEQSSKEKEKAEAIHKAGQEAQERARQEQQRILDELKKGKNKPPAFPDVGKEPPKKEDDNPFPPVKPPDTPRRPVLNPPDTPKPPVSNPPDTPKPPREMVQPAGVTITLNAPPLHVQVSGVLFSGAEKNQAVVVYKADPMKQDLHLACLDLATGMEVNGMDLPYDFGTSVRDFSPDGKYYLQNHAGTPYSIYAWPNATPVVSKWLPKAPKPDPQGFSNMVVAAYLLDGGKLVTVNGLGQVVRWIIPAAAGGQPTQEAAYVPPPTVAKYQFGMGYGLTAVSRDRKRVAVYNGSDGFFVLDTSNLQLVAQVKSPEDARPMENAVLGILGVAFSPDGNHLAGMFHQQRLPGIRQPKTTTPPRTTPPPRTKRTPKGKVPAPAPVIPDAPAPVPAAGPSGPTMVRWDLETKQIVARVTESSKGAGFAGSKVGWWGMDFCWASNPNRAGTLFSWEKQKMVLRAVLGGVGSRVFFDSPDGKCWYLTAAPENKSFLRCVNLPADELKNAEQPLLLKADGIVGK